MAISSFFLKNLCIGLVNSTVDSSPSLITMNEEVKPPKSSVEDIINSSPKSNLYIPVPTISQLSIASINLSVSITTLVLNLSLSDHAG